MINTNIVFWFILIILLILIWFILINLFKPIGGFLYKVFNKTKEVINEVEEQGEETK